MAGSGFLFNFNVDAAACDPGIGSGLSVLEEEGGACKYSVPKCVPTSKLIPILPCHWETASCMVPSVFSVPGSRTKLHYISGKQVYDVAHEIGSNVGTDDRPDGTGLESLLTLSDSQHSDLIPGVYEGGLKLWECALDMVLFLSESDIDFHGMRILELGCGIGLPGIYSAIREAEVVHFQDYNPEVLNCVTIPSVILNTGSKICNESLNTGNETGSELDTSSKIGIHAGNETGNLAGVQPENGTGSKNENGNEGRFKFFSGDWNGLASALEPVDRYDLILTSETIYSLESQPKLLSVLKELSMEGTGVVYVAAKTLYFGVGGGTDSFCRLVEGDGTFTAHLCQKIDASVPRVILKLTHKHQHLQC